MNDTQKSPELRIAADTLHAYVRAIWESAGSAPREAELVADHLVMSNLSGHDSHGVGMIPRYTSSLADGQLKLNTHAEIVRDAGAVITVDGRKGFGQVVAYEAMEFGIERAKKFGVCAVGLRNAHHIGRIGHWAEQCAKAGLVSFHFVNVAGDPLVAPFGGIDRRFGTNPFCAAYPRKGKKPLVLDFATAGIAYGKTRVAYNKGVQVAPGMLLDHAGVPTLEPKVMHEEPFGSLTAFGLHKGSGLAALCEIFGGALSGGYTTHESTLEKSSAIINCMTSVILDPNAFDAPAAEAEAEAFLEWMKASPKAAGTDAIHAPGEPEEARRAERNSNGVPVDPTTWRQIRESAVKSGMAETEIEKFAGALK
ncbi:MULTISPECIES: malate/lactate/ureidoglycolate dehydrogenase [unclassified Caballeronia]|uniref:malate/lactate/ureidoglycolate dehydrogenase n=1 Tax=unclassified Caballeronia TaxID=2646786 RepID=UPI001FCFC1A0|nr:MULTISPECIES: malate/lactate/ureidoglycolate dehydrogenase [unclassified Caballeronia]MDR5775845.1 malate/lactate/ureidoglycolate dehydrogenase [Caballeronia sp. LZ002]MDR5802010.1 malate/lactate/ureidoglycolate dehydrogenase [Caballeronia sp. LZ001]MDR5851284.1 malate/lactate/ureidoglycolate dehydrogenase [Caballeronia sp. LZ003]